MFRTVSIMPGMESRAPERQESSSGLVESPNFVAHDLLDAAGGPRSTWSRSSGGYLRPCCVEVGADLGGEGEAGRDGQADVGHLGEVGALAAEEVFHVARGRPPCRRRRNRRTYSCWCDPVGKAARPGRTRLAYRRPEVQCWGVVYGTGGAASKGLPGNAAAADPPGCGMGRQRAARVLCRKDRSAGAKGVRPTRRTTGVCRPYPHMRRPARTGSSGNPISAKGIILRPARSVHATTPSGLGVRRRATADSVPCGGRSGQGGCAQRRRPARGAGRGFHPISRRGFGPVYGCV